MAVASLRIGSDPERNLAHLLERINEASNVGAQLICFPEYCLNPVIEHWVNLDQPIAALRTACLEQRIWAVIGAESGDRKTRRNSILLIGPDGEIRERYDKIHLWRRERQFFCAGMAPARVIDIGVCRLGIVCCWDMAFANTVAALAAGGAELVLCPSRLVDAELDAEPLRALPLARAFENVLYFVLCDAVADDTLSESMICHPLGVRHRIAHTEGLLVADLDFNALADLRAYYSDAVNTTTEACRPG
ncbi:MAG: hypothetical protein N838_01695 [Thiohalocapsa sp. PB-PSB1]|nr:MAG: hypothetical protein N838_01695 [Thiohalocapsa sp. PB-PSB1]